MSNYGEMAKKLPEEMSNEEIDQYLRMVWGRVAGNMKNESCYSALLEEKSARRAAKETATTKMLSRIAIAVAVGSFLVTCWFSYMDWQGDKEWQARQLVELQLQTTLLESSLDKDYAEMDAAQ